MKPSNVPAGDPFAVFLKLTATSLSHGMYEPGGSRDTDVPRHRSMRLIDWAARVGRVLRSMHPTGADRLPGWPADRLTLGRYY